MDAQSSSPDGAYRILIFCERKYKDTFSFQNRDPSLLFEEMQKMRNNWDLKVWSKVCWSHWEAFWLIHRNGLSIHLLTCLASLTLRKVFLKPLGNVPLIMKANNHSPSTYLGVNWGFLHCQCISTEQAGGFITFFFLTEKVPCIYCRPRFSPLFVITITENSHSLAFKLKFKLDFFFLHFASGLWRRCNFSKQQVY